MAQDRSRSPSGPGQVSFNNFFWGIAQQESGGSYRAVNRGSGALGKYQIMPYNVPAWSKKYFGVAWSPSQFLNDPRKQDRLARAVLGDYYEKWGARGAASAWYSGNPALHSSYRPQNGGPSIGTYVDQVLARAATGGGDNSPDTGDTYTPMGNDSPEWQPRPYEGIITVNDQREKAKEPADMANFAYPGAAAVSAPGASPWDAEDQAEITGIDKIIAAGNAVTTMSPFEQRSGTFAPPKQPELTATSAEDAGATGSTEIGQGYKNQIAAIQKQFPGIRITSDFRPGAITASGNQSYHARGMAIDIAPSMAVFNWLRKTYGATAKELIYTPAGGKQVKNGKAFRYGSTVAGMHNDHIHWAQ